MTTVKTTVALEAELGDPSLRGWYLDLYLEAVRPDGSVGRWTEGDAIECVGVTLRTMPLPAPSPLDGPDPTPADPPRSAVTATVVRRVPWAGIIDRETRAEIIRQKEHFDQGLGSLADATEAAREAGAATLAQNLQDAHDRGAADREAMFAGLRGSAMFADLDRQPGRRGPAPRYARAHYEEVARVYRQEAQAGASSSPTKAVAEHFGVSRPTASRWVERARLLFPDDTLRAPRKGRPQKEISS